MGWHDSHRVKHVKWAKQAVSSAQTGAEYGRKTAAFRRQIYIYVYYRSVVRGLYRAIFDYFLISSTKNGGGLKDFWYICVIQQKFLLWETISIVIYIIAEIIVCLPGGKGI